LFTVLPGDDDTDGKIVGETLQLLDDRSHFDGVGACPEDTENAHFGGGRWFHGLNYTRTADF
jgi:hypothetical protein